MREVFTGTASLNTVSPEVCGTQWTELSQILWPSLPKLWRAGSMTLQVDLVPFKVQHIGIGVYSQICVSVFHGPGVAGMHKTAGTASS